VLGQSEFDDGDEELEKRFLELFSEEVQPHLEMVFHRFLSGRSSIKIHVGRNRCKPWDPFCTKNEGTDQHPSEKLGEGGKIVVTPFVLPHGSKMTEKELEAAAGKHGGWSAHQGFYIYRNRRMIIHGGYLDLEDLQAQEWYRLCRIKVDIPNNVDHEWNIDVRKALANPPLRFRKDLLRLANSTRTKASNRFKARTRTRSLGNRSEDFAEVWKRKAIGEKRLYTINRKNPTIKLMRDEWGVSKGNMNALLHLIEKSVPYRSITVDNNEIHDSTVDIPEEHSAPPKELSEYCIKLAKKAIDSGKKVNEAIDWVMNYAVPIPSAQLRFVLEEKLLGGALK
jgi:hypothetical protein